MGISWRKFIDLEEEEKKRGKRRRKIECRGSSPIDKSEARNPPKDLLRTTLPNRVRPKCVTTDVSSLSSPREQGVIFDLFCLIHYTPLEGVNFAAIMHVARFQVSSGPIDNRLWADQRIWRSFWLSRMRIRFSFLITFCFVFVFFFLKSQSILLFDSNDRQIVPKAIICAWTSLSHSNLHVLPAKYGCLVIFIRSK